MTLGDVGQRSSGFTMGPHNVSTAGKLTLIFVFTIRNHATVENTESLPLMTYGTKLHFVLICVIKKYLARRWRHMPLFPALGAQRQANLREFEANLVSRVNSGQARLRRKTLF